ncbi:MAG: HTH domain-containing protein [Haloarculaceae archaeon]
MNSTSPKEGEDNKSISVGDAESPTTTLYLRSAATGPAARRQRSVRDRFESIGAGPEEPELRVRRWGRTVTAASESAEDSGEALLGRYEAFATAVEAAGGHLEPFFEERERASGLLVGGRQERVVRFPVCCLAITRDGTTTGLYPCWLDGSHQSVEDGLDALAVGDPENLVDSDG